MSDAMAEALLGAVVRAGGSRQVVAATAVALWRAGRAASAQEADEKEVLEEVDARIGMIKPVIAAKVRAAHDVEPLRLTGEDKAIRNVAEHALFGEGAEALPKDGKEAKRRQRGRHRAGAALRAAATSSQVSDEECRERVTKIEDGCIQKEKLEEKKDKLKQAWKQQEAECDGQKEPNLFDTGSEGTVVEAPSQVEKVDEVTCALSDQLGCRAGQEFTRDIQKWAMEIINLEAQLECAKEAHAKAIQEAFDEGDLDPRTFLCDEECKTEHPD
mmetsp:Transcript_28758/g.75279  ORF Transcript_28758/g.75279 Transcript_28758/m.75279 type:complete len:272 (+) Transcript_28758:55-870(+)